jgi:hypothetical protein
MAYNFRKEQKELYVPEKSPSLISVPAMKYLAVRGHGDPNQEIGEQKKAPEVVTSFWCLLCYKPIISFSLYLIFMFSPAILTKAFFHLFRGKQLIVLK